MKWEADKLIERSIRLCVMAMKSGLSPEEKDNFSRQVIEELNKAAREDLSHPGLLSCSAALSLLVNGEPGKAAQKFAREIRIADGKYEKVRLIEDRRDDEVEALGTRKEAKAEMIAKKSEQDILSFGTQLIDEARYDVQLKLGEAKEAESDWRSALKYYMNLFKDDTRFPSVEQNKLSEVYTAIARCYLQLGQYNEAIDWGLKAVKFDRNVPGVHRLVAQAQKSSGDIKAARQTMSRAVFYETPWDEANVRSAKAFLEELKAD
mmetsp:Transcript_13230/g.33550  ORF Transcript_13230/g.33550 Transcript_13230/m.33550 type:complete len:263 (+) Transcript_13230:161-949(+)